MSNLFKHCFKVLLLTFLLSTSSPSDASWNSVKEYVENVSWGSSYFKSLSMCEEGDLILNNFYYSKFFSVYLPDSIPDTSNYKGKDADNAIAASMLGIAYANYKTFLIIRSTLLFSSAVLYAAFAYQVFVLNDVCTNTFIIQPHEYVNIRNGWVTVVNRKNVDPCAVTKHDVPYFFQCSDPNKYGYDRELCYGASTNSSVCSCKSSGGANGTCICSLPDGTRHIGTPPTYCLGRPNDVGSIKVGYDGPTPTHNSNGSSPFNPNKVFDLYPSTRSKRIGATSVGSVLYSYLDTSSVKPVIRACVASPSTIPPVKIGCASIAPPRTYSAPIDKYFSDTRCNYAYFERADLASVATILNDRDNTGHDSTSVANFLRGSLHSTSTVVGCIKDLMLKVIAIPYSTGSFGFLSEVQSSLRSMVYAMLVLYVTLVAIKIMSMASSIKPAEYIIFILKFALVVYFVTPEAWYQIDSSGIIGGVSGLARGLIFGAESLASIMIDALSASDPVGMCRYEMSDGSQLLNERMIYTTKTTAGYSGVKLSMWDYIDCKLINYLNFGSCNYSYSGILGMWMIGMLVTGFTIVPFALAVVLIVYCIIIFKIVCKMVSIFIMSSISITVLIIVSPLFIGLSLFTFSKGMFDTWMRKLFAYTIYPAFLTAGFCLMIIVLDSIYNGTYSGATMSMNAASSIPENEQIQTMCKGNDSVFCTTVRFAGPPCSASAGAIADSLTRDSKSVISNFTKILSVLKPSVVSAYFSAMLPLLLFAILFSTFFNAMISIAEFISGVSGLSAAHDNSIVTKFMSEVIRGAKSMAASTGKKGLEAYTNRKKR